MSEIAKREHGAIDMTQGSPTRLIVAFSLPLLLGNVLQQLYNMVDSIVVGQFVGASALTAVGTGFPIIFLLASLFIGFAMGATVMIAQSRGQTERGAHGGYNLQRAAGGHRAAVPAGSGADHAPADPDPGACRGL